MANLYFTDSPLRSSSSEVILSGDEARHAVQVARLRVGESVDVADGRGSRASATVLVAEKSEVRLTVSDVVVDPVPSPRFILVQALAKGDRDERAIQAATELGVDVVVPWQAERSVSRWSSDKTIKGVSRWSAVVREASKQAMRSRIPEVVGPMPTSEIVTAFPDTAWLVLDPRAERSVREWCDGGPERKSVGVIVGPEGGISEAELDAFVESGATPVRIAPHVLRTSTAGPVALAVLGTLLRDW